MLDVRRLLVLREVARRGSLSAAAEALGFTPSAVSQQISALERQTGERLLERGARGVVLTEAGSLLTAHAERVLDELDAAEAAMADLSASRGGRLRFASFATAAATVVPAVVESFRTKHPLVDVLVEQATSTEALIRLRHGRLDVVLIVDQPTTADLDIVTLFDDPFRLALPQSHPLAGAPTVALADVAGDRWIDVPAHVPGGGVATRSLAALGRSANVAHRSEDYTAIHAMVGAGLGIALLPDLADLPPNPDVVFRAPADGTPTRAVQVATRPEAMRSPAASAMLAVLRRYEPPTRLVDPRDAVAQVAALTPPSRYVAT